MRDITLEELLEAGCHFGHQVNRRNPRATEFIFEARDGVNIIDLEATRNGLLEAARFVKELAQKDGSLVIVGTKRQARPIVRELAEKAIENGAKNLYFVTSRWIGGTITNFDEVKKNYKKLKDTTEFLQSGKDGGYTKRELILMQKDRDKLENLYGGIKDLVTIPDALFIIDTHLETTAINEAKSMDVKTLGVVDTNSDPSLVNHPIPANDDAVGSIRIITEFIVDAWIEGLKKAEKEVEKAVEKAAMEEKKEAVAEVKQEEKVESKPEKKIEVTKKDEEKAKKSSKKSSDSKVAKPEKTK